MSILKMLETFSDVKVETASPQTRRASLMSMMGIGKDIAMAAIPAVLLTSLPKKGYAAPTSAITDVLNFALTLEYLEASFYNQGVAAALLIPVSDLPIFQQIKKHENAHVTLLQNTITALGGTPVTSPVFDFTAGGMFNPFVVYNDFLALAQAFEDTGVRAYKGQAGNLISNNDVLTAALQIHSVEARHASEVRRLRNKRGLDASTKGWITGNSRGTLPAATQATYNGEENVVQGGVNVTTITSVGTPAIQEAFDEGLTQAEVLAIANLFIV